MVTFFLGKQEESNSPGGAKPSNRASSTISQLIKTGGLLLLSISTPHAQAFDLSDLSAQLAKPIVVRGPFVQE